MNEHRSTGRTGDTAAIAVLSWAWAAVAVETAPRPAPWPPVAPLPPDQRSYATCGS
ncbi:MAG: hypothetical protein M3326_13265 [Actinomycetota bacterium]|nr:hypothetical protein [Actinomycetota bacterium]